jgi:phosphoribosylamine--glycine ligase
MKVLLIGSGGREHAIARQLSTSPRLTQLFIAPGNPGTAQYGQNVSIADTDIDQLVRFSQTESIDLVMVGPEAPLVLGLVDRLDALGIHVVGPNREAAQLEGSKRWAKDKMQKYGIPTAKYASFTELELAVAYIRNENQYPIVIKADGLAAGKGVVIAASEADAIQALKECMVDKKFNDAGNTVVIEQFLVGEEASVFAFTDGKTVLPMVAAQDHKAIYDGDKGPNTGGMGAYSPAPVVTDAVMQKIVDRAFIPLVDGFRSDGITYKGIIFAGLMIHDGEPYVIEYNARFGDPETQVVLPRLQTDLLDVLIAVATGTLDQIQLQWDSNSTVCVVIASEGYPGDYEKGIPIEGLDFLFNPNTWVIHAGTRKNAAGAIETNGGRVLGVVASSSALETAIKEAYIGVDQIKFKGKYSRRDIGAKGL